MATPTGDFTNALLDPSQQQQLADFFRKMTAESTHFLGYPCSIDFDYSPLYPFLSLPLNNIGDPYLDSRYHLNTHEYERQVIDFFATLLHASDQQIWGYVTSGGTEGNMYGLYLAREIYPDGLVYYSEASHYSVPKILRMLGARSIMIKSRANGEIDYQDLAATMGIHRDVPAIIFANIGTTMTGAVDNIATIKNQLEDFAITRAYIHCDAALGGMILPFVDAPPPFNFADGVDSISISGHKMIGSPIPCGIAMAAKSHVDRIARAVEYIGTFDTTVTGSRNAITVLFLWYAINNKGAAGFSKIIARCLATADYAIAAFAKIGVKAWRNQHSITVVFPATSDKALEKWQIATQKDLAHIITMPHVTTAQIDQFIADITPANQQVQP